MWSSDEGAVTMLYLGTQAAEDGARGSYFHPQAVEVAPHPLAESRELQDGLWAFCNELVREQGE